MKHNRTHCSGITSTDIFSSHPDPELLFFNDTATTELYTEADTRSLHDALRILPPTA